MKLNSIFFLLLILSMGQSALANITRPGEDGQPTKIYVSIYILNLDSVDTANQSFIANIYFIYKWHDSRLVHKGPGLITQSLHEVWNPRIQIANQQKVFPTFPEEVSISPEGEVIYFQRVWGSFSQPLQLRNFPFDKQFIKTKIVTVQYSSNEVQLIANPQFSSGIADKVSVTDWKIGDWETITEHFQPSPNAITISAFELSVSIERRVDYYIINVIIPLMLILAMSWMVFWIEPKGSSGTKISLAATCMLTLIAFRFAIGASIPKLSYLTRLDEFILWSTVLIFATLLEAVYTSAYEKYGKFHLALTIDRWCRWIFPSMFILVALMTLVIGL